MQDRLHGIPVVRPFVDLSSFREEYGGCGKRYRGRWAGCVSSFSVISYEEMTVRHMTNILSDLYALLGRFSKMNPAFPRIHGLFRYSHVTMDGMGHRDFSIAQTIL